MWHMFFAVQKLKNNSFSFIFPSFSLKMCISLMGLSLALTGCSSTPKTPAKQLCSGTKRPYEIKGIRYEPQDHYEYEETGVASWYGPGFHQKPGSCGTKFDMHSYTAAHKTLPIPSVVEVTNVDNGKTLHVVINDRGPFVGDRIIDLSKKVAMELGTHGKGLGQVKVKALPEQSVALANYLKQFGPYGVDPSGRGWDEIYRTEIADKFHEYLDKQETKEEQITHAVYHPEIDQEAHETLAVLSPPSLKAPKGKGKVAPPIHARPQNKEFEKVLNEVAEEQALTNVAFKRPLPPRNVKPRHLAAPAPQYFVKVGQYVQKQNAVSLQEELTSYGKASIDRTSAAQGQQFFTVKLGPFSSKQQAQQVMKTITKQGYYGVQLTQ